MRIKFIVRFLYWSYDRCYASLHNRYRKQSSSVVDLYTPSFHCLQGKLYFKWFYTFSYGDVITLFCWPYMYIYVFVTATCWLFCWWIWCCTGVYWACHTLHSFVLSNCRWSKNLGHLVYKLVCLFRVWIDVTVHIMFPMWALAVIPCRKGIQKPLYLVLCNVI
jgi:hypothetical protein